MRAATNNLRLTAGKSLIFSAVTLSLLLSFGLGRVDAQQTVRKMPSQPCPDGYFDIEDKGFCTTFSHDPPLLTPRQGSACAQGRDVGGGYCKR